MRTRDFIATGIMGFLLGLFVGRAAYEHEPYRRAEREAVRIYRGELPPPSPVERAEQFR